MQDPFTRTRLLLGDEAMDRLRASRVAVFGVGGVGGYVVEALARSGIGALDLIDSDCVSESNLNRQILATRETIGRPKVDVACERVAAIHPECRVRTFEVFYLPENENLFDFSCYDYVIDAIDTVSGKIALVINAQKAGTPVISAMGAGNKLDPSQFEVADLYETSICPLARVMRRELRRRGVEHLKVVYSTETPVSRADRSGARPVPGSVSFVPGVVGLIIAGEVVRDLIRK